MSTAAIIQELTRMPLTERLLVIEQTLRSIREEQTGALERAVSLAYTDYTTDPELTAFTVLDAEPFYEAK